MCPPAAWTGSPLAIVSSLSNAMTTKTFLVRIVVVLSVIVACHDAAGPIARTMPVPTLAKKTLGAPTPRSYFLSSNPGGGVALSQYAYDTWVTLLASGSINLTAQPPIPGASPYYVPGGPVGVTGKIDHHPGAPCVLNISLSDGYGALPSWGACEDPGKTDTVLFRKLQTPVAKRGPLPVKHYYDCSNTSDVCHSVNLQEFSTIVEQPIPVTLNNLATNKHISTFVTPPAVVFTASRTPSSITVGGSVVSHPIAITLWQWIGADTTRLPVTGYCAFPSANLVCNFSPRESGRMVAKAFTGGWEQTTSTTVQCLMAPPPDMSPPDSLLNDSTNDFGLRETLLEALAMSNPDSAAGVGADSTHRGFRHEEGGRIYQWTHGPNTGKHFFVRADDPNATECHVNATHGELENPILGAKVVAYYHTHPITPPDSVYGCRKDSDTGKEYAQYPGDGKDPYRIPKMDSAQYNYDKGGASPGDWSATYLLNKDSYVIWKDGTVYKIGRNNLFPADNANYWSAFGAARDSTKPAGKCTWPKKYPT